MLRTEVYEYDSNQCNFTLTAVYIGSYCFNVS